MSVTIEKRAFDIFMVDYKKGKFNNQRLGQAFYNCFKLYKITNQADLNNIFAKDGEHAMNCIKTIVQFS